MRVSAPLGVGERRAPRPCKGAQSWPAAAEGGTGSLRQSGERSRDLDKQEGVANSEGKPYRRSEELWLQGEGAEGSQEETSTTLNKVQMWC